MLADYLATRNRHRNITIIVATFDINSITGFCQGTATISSTSIILFRINIWSITSDYSFITFNNNVATFYNYACHTRDFAICDC